MVVGLFPEIGNGVVWSSSRGLHPCRFMISCYVWSIVVENFWMLLRLFSWGCEGDHNWNNWHLQVFVEGYSTCLWFAVSFFGLGYLLGCFGSHNIVFEICWSYGGHSFVIIFYHLYFIFFVMISWFLYLFSLLDVENMGKLWRLDKRDVSCSVFAIGFAYLCGWSLILHDYTFFVLLSADSVCGWFLFRFNITHVVGVLVCVWSSSISLYIELEVAIYGVGYVVGMSFLVLDAFEVWMIVMI